MEKLPIQGCNCNALRKAMRRVSGFYDSQLAPSGLRATQFAILALINGHGELAVGDMAEKMAMDRTTAGKNLRPLEKAGLVRVAASDSDGRKRAITLTQAGHAILKKALPLWQAAQKHFETKNAQAAQLRAALDTLAL